MYLKRYKKILIENTSKKYDERYSKFFHTSNKRMTRMSEQKSVELHQYLVLFSRLTRTKEYFILFIRFWFYKKILIN